MAASDLLDAVSNAANLEYEPALFDSVSGQLVCDSDLAGGERVPDVGEVICPSESSDLTDGYDGDDDESLTFGDSSRPSAQLFTLQRRRRSLTRRSLEVMCHATTLRS